MRTEMLALESDETLDPATRARLAKAGLATLVDLASVTEGWLRKTARWSTPQIVAIKQFLSESGLSLGMPRESVRPTWMRDLLSTHAHALPALVDPDSLGGLQHAAEAADWLAGVALEIDALEPLRGAAWWSSASRPAVLAGIETLQARWIERP